MRRPVGVARGSGPLPGLRTLPFVLAGLVGAAMALLDVQHPAAALAAGALALVTAAAAVALPWGRLPSWAPVGLALVVVADVALLLYADGARAGTAAMVLLPVFWLALFGTWRQLALVLACVPLAVLLPGLLDPAVSTGDAVRATVTITVTAAALGVATHQLVREVRALRHAERQAHERVRRILDTSPDTAVITWSPDRVITGVNRGAAVLFGAQAEEAEGRLSPADLIGAEAIQALTEALGYGNPADPAAEEDDLIPGSRWGAEAREVSGVTARIPGDGGTHSWVLLDLSAITDDEGRAVEYVLVAHDITDLHQTQDELDAVRRGLATVVEVLRHAQLGEDVRVTVCRHARELAAADVAIMLERHGDVLEVTAQDGVDLTDLQIPLIPDQVAAARAYSTGRRVQIADTETDPRASPELARQTGMRSLLYEPVRHDGRVVAVLGVGWAAPRSSLSALTAESVWVLANEAGLAMHREHDVHLLEDRARRDPLTGIANRREWDSVLARALGPDAPRWDDGRTVCLAMLDLDRFKDFNDAYGHQAGDDLLRSAAAAWRAQLRSSDVLARYGGEEFAVLLPGCRADEAVAVLERLRAATPGRATVSAGLAAWDGLESASALVGRADAALYAAKTSGRDRLMVADADPVAT